ncbi:MAG: ribosome-associated translation inhibitor RaiA [Candidatus Eisenbacteria bacterium]|uniref:Ribosome-associated translation inhibitor RaiA n=1 Tax=Eiseniibacteriota bacterium TaxID=2212470 RepID=A0A938BPS4_UNCEI|nr:ribosome-associated translation inhibitor RaiA [Candidatus Eisenbacteria bacterium]
MDIITTARRFELTPEVREHARKRLQKLLRYSDRIDEVHVVLTTEKFRQIAEVALHVKGTEILSREESDEMMISIDRVVERVERQLKRARGRRKDHRAGRRGAAATAIPGGAEAEIEEGEETGEELEAEEVFSPVVIREEAFHAEPLTVEQAIELLREREQELLLFPSARSGRIAVVRRRADGNYGLVEAH